MTTSELIDRARTILRSFGTEKQTNDPDRTDFIIDKSQLVGAASALRQSHWGYLSAVTGLDQGLEAGGNLEVLYSFCEGAAVVTLRALIPRADARVQTLRHVVPSVVLFERELSEMFGIAIQGESDPSHEFLSDDWPEGSYPLRKDWKPETGIPRPQTLGDPSGADDGK